MPDEIKFLRISATNYQNYCKLIQGIISSFINKDAHTYMRLMQIKPKRRWRKERSVPFSFETRKMGAREGQRQTKTEKNARRSESERETEKEREREREREREKDVTWSDNRGILFLHPDGDRVTVSHFRSNYLCAAPSAATRLHRPDYMHLDQSPWTLRKASHWPK